MLPPPPAVLVFAASDPTGGAGLQADAQAIAAAGCHALTVVTALTAQDTHGVHAVRQVEPDFVEEQARTVLADIRVAAFKLGVLGSAQNAALIARLLAEHPGVPVVVDPVLASGRGDILCPPEVIAAMLDLLFPLATVVTPNSVEARHLARADALADCARVLLARGCPYVLMKGAHEEGGDVANVLYAQTGVVRADLWPRLPGSYHGSGCTLASALAARLALGIPVPEAAYAAQAYTWTALRQGFRAGRGQLLPRRLGVDA